MAFDSRPAGVLMRSGAMTGAAWEEEDMTRMAFTGARVFYGGTLHENIALVIEGGRVLDLRPSSRLPEDLPRRNLREGILAPAFVDLQVNGGGGVMLGDDPSVATLRTMAETHARLGATTILPTLISDTPAKVASAIDAVAAAVDGGVKGIAGLHLEGPHLDPARAGAHDPSVIRPMEDSDLRMLCEAAARLPVLKVTLAPEAATPAQIAALVEAGVLVALGHSNCRLDAARETTDAGARLVTHLFNAMSQLQGRSPGLVGAALSDGRLSAGLIADGVHVHPVSMKAAVAAKRGPGRIYLVSDAMAVAGTRRSSFEIGGRKVLRANGRLTLTDGTLAGADLTLWRAVQVMVEEVGLAQAEALATATQIPADIIGSRAGRLDAGCPADFVHLGEDLELRGVWRGGLKL